jgi:hypothetical protein
MAALSKISLRPSSNSKDSKKELEWDPAMHLIREAPFLLYSMNNPRQHSVSTTKFL